MSQLDDSGYSAGFMPHGMCYLWRPDILGLHVVSDAVIAISYFSIPFTLLYFLRKRVDLKFKWIVGCFAIFIVACGASHLTEIWTVWQPVYWISGGVKAITAVASAATALLLVRMLPILLALPSPAALERANQQLEQEIGERRTAEQKYRSLLESAPDSMVIVDGHGRIQLVNAQTERLFGYSRDELIGKDVELLVPQRLRVDHHQHRQRFDAEPRVRNMGAGKDLAGLRKDGSEFAVEVSLSPHATEGAAFVSAAIRDVTDHKNALKTVALAQEAAEMANRDLEAFSYSVAHDLRTPLRAIDGFSLALLEDHAKNLDTEAQSHLARVRTAAQFMARLIDDLLMLAHVTQREITAQCVDLSHLARESIARLKDSEPTTEVDVQIACGLVAQCDAQLLGIVFDNLLGNAWKFSARSGAPRIEVGQIEQDAQTVFFVRDNGAGFDMAYAGKLFRAFQRLHVAEEFPGTGIGLATVHRIIRRHGGRIWAQGQVGRGASFFFTLNHQSKVPHVATNDLTR